VERSYEKSVAVPLLLIVLMLFNASGLGRYYLDRQGSLVLVWLVGCQVSGRETFGGLLCFLCIDFRALQ